MTQILVVNGQENAIYARNLKKNFGSLAAVDGIDFTIKKQEIVGILGPNGAGKTTTIRLLTGLFPLLPGSEIDVFKHDMAKKPLECKSLFGIVPEVSNAFLDYSVTQNLHFTGRLYGLKNADIKNRTALLLKQFDLTDKAYAITKTLSKGLKQRLNFCMALIHDPPILILDEPTSGLDPISVRVLRDQILQLRDAGKTILLTTHDMLEAQKVCDRILIINKGKIIVDEVPDTLRAKFGSGKTILFKPEKELPENLQPLLEARVSAGKSLKLLKNGYYQFTTKNALSDLTTLSEFAQSKGIIIKDVKIEETSLEDVFIQLIQKEGKGNE